MNCFCITWDHTLAYHTLPQKYSGRQGLEAGMHDVNPKAFKSVLLSIVLSQDNFAQNGLSQVTHVSDTVLPSPSISASAPAVPAPPEIASQPGEATSLPLSSEQVLNPFFTSFVVA